jgi:hypothetical protein
MADFECELISCCPSDVNKFAASKVTVGPDIILETDKIQILRNASILDKGELLGK